MNEWATLENLMTDWIPMWDDQIKDVMKLVNPYGVSRVNAAGTMLWQRLRENVPMFAEMCEKISLDTIVASLREPVPKGAGSRMPVLFTTTQERLVPELPPRP